MSPAAPPLARDAARRNALLPFMLLLFVGSGCAALVYEIVWLQMLSLLVGATGISLGVLLGTFMGGMCLGSLLLPRFVSRQAHPLVVYALLELGIGIIGIVLWYAFPFIDGVYTYFSAGGSMSIVWRSIVAAICLLPPTLLMGATLPAIARYVETTPQGVAWLGYFYGGNIVGAVFGCLLAGFYLLRVYDMQTATFVAAAINAAVAVIAMGLAAIAEYQPAVETHADSLDTRKEVPPILLYVVIGLSGLTALGAEVIWTRLLSLLLGATVYTFSIILAVFLVGLGIGSSLGAMVAGGTRSPRWALGTCQMLLAAGIGWTALIVTHSIPYWPINPELAAGLTNGDWGPWYMFQLDFVRALYAVLPGALLWGASFPIALAAIAGRGQDPGKLVGGVYAANTVGAILGALLFSVWVVPSFGTPAAQKALVVIALISSALALFPLFVLPGSRTDEANSGSGAFFPIALALQLCVGVGLGVWIVNGIEQVPWQLVGYGRQMMTFPPGELVPGIVKEEDIPKTPNNYENTYCVYVGEGMNVSVAVTKTNGFDGTRSFHGAGKVQASSLPQDMRLQRLLGHISALCKKDPENVLVVACGAGVTAGSFVVHPEVKRIVICDIEPLVPTKVTPMFTHQNFGIVDNISKQNPTHVKFQNVPEKEVQVYYDDGRHYIRTTKEMFDVITSDPIDPWVKGCAALNTVEYYQMCKDHLKEGGVMSLWIPLYESNPETIQSVLMTFFKVFPNGILWSNDSRGEGYDAVLFGVKDTPEKPFQINLDEFVARWKQPDHEKVRMSAAEVGFFTPMEMLATYGGSAHNLQTWGAEAQINTDRDLRLQYLAGLAFNSQIGGKIFDSMLEHYTFPKELFTGSQQNLDELRIALDAAGRSRLAKPGAGQ